MKLTLTCEHGTRTVEFDEGREGIGNVQSLAGKRSFAQKVVTEVTPRCPYCEAQHAPRLIVGSGPFCSCPNAQGDDHDWKPVGLDSWRCGCGATKTAIV